MLATAITASDTPAHAFEPSKTLRRARVAAAKHLGRNDDASKKAKGWFSLRVRDLLLPLFIPREQKAQERLFA